MSATNIAAGTLASLDQRRAQHAWAKVESIKDLSKDEAGRYAGEAKKLPVRVMASGLGQALAYIASKAKKKDRPAGFERLQADLTEWVLRERFADGSLPPTEIARADSLLGSVVHGDTDFTRWAATETLAYLVWLNRFAEAEGLANDGD